MRPGQHVTAGTTAHQQSRHADAAGEYALASAGYERRGDMERARIYADWSRLCRETALGAQLAALLRRRKALQTEEAA